MRPNRPRRPTLAAALAAAAVAALSAAPSPARAVSPPASMAEVAGRADLAVHGRVKRVEARWNRDRTAIYSEVTVEVIESRGKGGGGREVTLRVPGGEVGGVGMRVAHASRPVAGEEVVVLLAGPGGAAESAATVGPAEATGLDADERTLTVAGGERGWMPVRFGAVDVGAGRKAPVAEVLSTVSTSLRK